MRLIILLMVLLFLVSNASAQDVKIDENGTLTTGATDTNANLEVTGTPGEDGIVGLTSSGAAGIYGENTTSGNYGFIGHANYGIYGNSSGGYAGYFQGNARITGDLTVDGATNITGFDADTLDGLDSTDFSSSTHNHDSSYVNENQVDSVTSSMIVDGTIQQVDLSFALGDGHSLDAADGNPTDVVFVDNTGNVGVGTVTPSGKLDVNGDICLGSVCRTTWPSGSGTGAFTDSGSSAYYNGGDVGIGTSSPTGLTNVDSRVLHMSHPVAPSGDTAVGLRLEIEGLVDAGLMSAYNAGGNGGLFVGTLSNHRVGLGTNGVEQASLATNGYFGIGTPSPLQNLHVQGNAYVYDKLGIGIDSPSHNLEVSGSTTLMSSGTGNFHLILSKGLSSSQSSLVFQDNYTGYAEIGLTGDNNLHFKVSSDGSTFNDAMMIDTANRYIGIGTMSPENLLSIYANESNPAVIMENDGTGSILFAWKKNDGDAVNIRKQTGLGSALVIDQWSSDPAMIIRNDLSDLFVVESGGNVGIGTSTPQGKLDVNGAIYQRGGVLHADYVFEDDYELESIREHAEFMWTNKHLKAIPKAMVDKNGNEIVEVGAHRKGIVEELEKAHIYIEQLHKQLKDQERMISLLEKRLTRLEK